MIFFLSVCVREWQDDVVFDISDSSVSVLDVLSKNVKLSPGSLPNSIENISICSSFNAHVLPNSVKTMTVDCHNQEFLPGLFPHSLESLTLYMYDNPLMEHSLPHNLKSLHLGTYHAEPHRVDIGNLPRSLETIQFHYSFAEQIENIPILSQFQRLTTLIGCHFEWIGSLPPSVTTLRFTTCYLNSEYIKPGAIPSTITDLDFGGMRYFNLQPGSIPSSVSKLSLGYFEHSLEPGVIPIGVIYLDLSHAARDFSAESIPNTVESLKYLNYSYSEESKFLGILSLPSIKKLFFYADIKISIFPPYLESLKLSGNGVPLLYSSLPPTLKKLSLNKILFVKDTLNETPNQPKRLLMKVGQSYFNNSTLEDLPLSVEIIKIHLNIELRRFNKSTTFIGYNREYPISGGFIKSTYNLRDLIYDKEFDKCVNNDKISTIIK
ncbi:hypothetical protein PPL_02439 [Heterostelium album PN500]|uniref:Uncharacterized protein n=1 Tax=Heterostelium pallidum (strain ATCC 26659 / Pp 5 / PN500) TaxID=670386 RepID=D3AZQ5_HETP5|nr:hypothetical protein PPL_02439 [Heterostelium album PN500]EFA85434.1 hypothetical protein PPL_02439 [Heterostelium album PN500]|eukprot:XP_020437543.1 hypothetical protein PPL_02439 [Heterostelium album PN500]